MCPIPDFNHNHVLPPHKGNPTASSDVSPYESTIEDFCNRFSTSTRRIEILVKFVEFRIRMFDYGIINGFQWIDGSFIENIEVSESRDPKDIDVVTFCKDISVNQKNTILNNFPEFVDLNLSKKDYFLDHYIVEYALNPDVTVMQTSYWVQLFTHNRIGIQKGIIKLPLGTIVEDKLVLGKLKSRLS